MIKEGDPDFIGYISYKSHIPNSKQMRYFAMDSVREFNMPVYLRTYTSNKDDLRTNGYIDWVVNRVQEIGKLSLKFLRQSLKITFYDLKNLMIRSHPTFLEEIFKHLTV